MKINILSELDIKQWKEIKEHIDRQFTSDKDIYSYYTYGDYGTYDVTIITNRGEFEEWEDVNPNDITIEEIIIKLL